LKQDALSPTIRHSTKCTNNDTQIIILTSEAVSVTSTVYSFELSEKNTKIVKTLHIIYWLTWHMNTHIVASSHGFGVWTPTFLHSTPLNCAIHCNIHVDQFQTVLISCILPGTYVWPNLSLSHAMLMKPPIRKLFCLATVHILSTCAEKVSYHNWFSFCRHVTTAHSLMVPRKAIRSFPGHGSSWNRNHQEQ